MRVPSLLSMVAAVVASAVFAPSVGAGPTPDVVFVIEAGPGADKSNYATPAMVLPLGAQLDFENLDIAFHNVVARDDLRSDGTATWCAQYSVGACPLFWSPLVPLLGRTTVRGLEAVEPLTAYTFYCTTHKGMEGTLLTLT